MSTGPKEVLIILYFTVKVSFSLHFPACSILISPILHLRPYSQEVVTAGSATCLIWKSFMLDAHPDTTPKGYVSLPGTFYKIHTLKLCFGGCSIFGIL